MQNIVLYAVENGAGRPLASCGPKDASRFFTLGSAGMQAASDARARGVAAPRIVAVLETRVTDAGGLTLAKQEFTLLDPATFEPQGKAVKELAALFAEKE